MSSTGGRELRRIFCAVLTILCRDFQSEALQAPDQQKCSWSVCSLYSASVKGGEVHSPHPMWKVHALLSSLYQSSSWMGQDQGVCNLHPQELGAVDSLHCCVVNEECCVDGLVPPEVNNDLLSFVNIQS